MLLHFSSIKKLVTAISLLACTVTTSTAQDNSIFILQEKLEDVKRSVVELEAKLPAHASYHMALEAYLAVLQTFKQADVKNKLDKLQNDGDNPKESDFKLLISELGKIRFDYNVVRTSDPAVSSYNKEISNNFRQRIDNMIGPIDKYDEFYILDEEGQHAKQLIKEAVAEINKFLAGMGENGLADKLLKETNQEIALNKSKKEELEKNIKAKRDEKLTVLSSMGAKEQINKLAIQLGLPLFCATVVLLFIGPYLNRRLNKNATEEANRNSNEHISKIMLEVITVLLITMTILILGLAKILEPNVLGTLLGAIAGYILNRSRADAVTTTAPAPPATPVPPKKPVG